MKRIEVRLSTDSITQALRELRKQKRETDKKMTQLCKRLAELGAIRVSLEYSRAWYVGPNNVSVYVRKSGNGYKIVASGQSVAFVEFGAGAKYGGGYPTEETKVPPDIPVPGSWSTDPTVGKGHWDSPNGWYLPNGVVGKSGENHSFGNAPTMGMYQAGQDIRASIEQVAREVFQ